MNLHSVVSRAIGAINPLVRVGIRVSTGSTTNGDGTRTPSYAPIVYVMAQLQSLTTDEMVQADALNIQGVRSKIWLPAKVEGLVRAENKGGDLLTLADGTIWRVATILESWPGWTATLITLQNSA